MRSHLRWTLLLAALALLVAPWGLASARAADPDGAQTPAQQSPAAPAPPTAQDLAVKKVDKLINSARDKMNDLQKEEFQIEMISIKSEGTALQAVKDPKNVTKNIAAAKGALSPELKAYSDVVLAAAAKWREFQQRYSAIGRNVTALEKERANVPANLQTSIDDLSSKYNLKNRSLQLKVIELYEKAADYRDAIAVATAAYQEIPEDKRAAERALKETVGDLYYKSQDYAHALATFKSILDARPEADRYKDAKLCEKLGDAYKGVPDAKNALDMYKRSLAALGGAKTGKDGKPSKTTEGIQKKIATLEKQIGTPAPAAPAPAK